MFEENEKEYLSKLKLIEECSFSKIREIANEEVSIQKKRLNKSEQSKLKDRLDRGVKILDDHLDLCLYLHFYGNMHQEKLLHCFNEINDEVFNDEIEIIDWGCGQALGAMCLFDYLNEQNKSKVVKKITLIEPSSIAIKRAADHIKCFVNDSVEIITKNKFFEELSNGDIKSNKRTVIHILSNVIDIEEINLTNLVTLIKSLGQNDNYIISFSPVYKNTIEGRYNKFLDLFGDKVNLIKKIDKKNYVYPSNKNKVKKISFYGLIFSYNSNYINKQITSQSNTSFSYFLPLILSLLIASYILIGTNFFNLNNVNSSNTSVEILNDSSFLKESNIYFDKSIDSIVNENEILNNHKIDSLSYIQKSVLQILNSLDDYPKNKKKHVRKELLNKFKIKLTNKEINDTIESLDSMNISLYNKIQ
jgi:hypothetical protein